MSVWCSTQAMRARKLGGTNHPDPPTGASGAGDLSGWSPRSQQQRPMTNVNVEFVCSGGLPMRTLRA
eukprot:11151857-Alexandrium_andersonii.AAC.1